jgi:chromosomal replication initiation ATPase DnaA
MMNDSRFEEGRMLQNREVVYGGETLGETHLLRDVSAGVYAGIPEVR